MRENHNKFTRCAGCKIPTLCIQSLECQEHKRRSLREIERDLEKTLKANHTNSRDKRISHLQQRLVLTPGEQHELDFLLKLKWAGDPTKPEFRT